MDKNTLDELLSVAVYNDSYNECKKLLDMGADTNSIFYRYPPLSLAVESDPKIVKLLLDYGASINEIDDDDFTALMTSVNFNKIDSAKILLEYGAEPNIKNAENIDALYLAIENNNINLVKLLLQYGANITQKHIRKAKYYPKIKNFLERVRAMYGIKLGINRYIEKGKLEYYPNDLIKRVSNYL